MRGPDEFREFSKGSRSALGEQVADFGDSDRTSFGVQNSWYSNGLPFDLRLLIGTGIRQMAMLFFREGEVPLYDAYDFTVKVTDHL